MHCKFLNPVLCFNRRIFTFTHFFCLHLTFFVYFCNQKQHRKSTWSTSLSLCLFLVYSFTVLIQTSVSRFSIFFLLLAHTLPIFQNRSFALPQGGFTRKGLHIRAGFQRCSFLCSRKYMRFLWWDSLYEFKCFCFSPGPATQAFT